MPVIRKIEQHKTEVMIEWRNPNFMSTNEKLTFLEFYVAVLKNKEKVDVFSKLESLTSWPQLYFKARIYFNERTHLFDINNFTKVKGNVLIEMSFGEQIIAQQQLERNEERQSHIKKKKKKMSKA